LAKLSKDERESRLAEAKYMIKALKLDLKDQIKCEREDIMFHDNLRKQITKDLNYWYKQIQRLKKNA
jgi:hypothetical protein